MLKNDPVIGSSNNDSPPPLQKSASIQRLPITSFLGRDREIGEILSRLADPACQLLSLIGPGGSGKTRLALEVAALAAASDASAVYFIPLQSLASSEGLICAIAESLNIVFDAGNDPKEQLLTYLMQRPATLVLDNFEQLLDARGLIDEIVARTHFVKLLVTSRERLHLQSEWISEVGGLAYPPEEDSERVETYAAVQLFLNRAKRAYPDLVFTDELAVIARICTLLDGMPLAIELASSWTRALSCTDILNELQHGLDLLETAAFDMLARHRSMRTVLVTSWNRLSSSECAVFQALSVFRGGFTLEAMQQVAGATPPIISRLIDQCWLRRDERSGRYLVHEVMRQYGKEKLHQSAETAAQIMDRHCLYYLDFLSRAEEGLKGIDPKACLQAINADLENIQLALTWATERSDGLFINPTLYSLYFFYSTGSRFHEGEQLFARLAAQLRATTPTPDQSLMLGRVLAFYGSMCHNLDRHDQAILLLEEALGIFRRLNASQDIAFCLYRIGVTLRFWEGRILEAQDCFQSSLELYMQSHDSSGMVKALGWLGIISLAQGDVTRALEATLTSITLAHEYENSWDRANAVVFRGEVLKGTGHYPEARRCFQKAYALYDELGIQWGMIKAIREIGELSLMLGNYVDARRCLRQAFTIAQQRRLRGHTLYTLVDYGKLLVAQGRFEPATEIFTFLAEAFADLHQERQSIIEHLNQLQSKLTPARFAAAVQAGHIIDWETTIQAAVDELNQPCPPADSLSQALTPREDEILHLIAAGLSNREIAGRLVLTPGTVKWYVSQMLNKLGVNSRTQLIAYARQFNLLS